MTNNDDDTTRRSITISPDVETMVPQHCYLIRNALDLNEQKAVFHDIMEKSKTVDNTTTTKVMYPSPKTILFHNNDDNTAAAATSGKQPEPTLKYMLDDDNDECIYNDMIIRKANEILSKIRANHHHHDDKNSIWNTEMEEAKFKRVVVGAIRYPVPNGSFPEHIDHCNSWVYLLSLGCTATFTVRSGPSSSSSAGDVKKNIFNFHSGDVLVFNASTEAAIRHGVMDINHVGSCPEELAEAFEVLRTHRFGVQCRVKE